MLDRASALAPSRVRYQVVGLTVLLAMVTYLDRVAISKLAPDIMADLHLSKVQMGWIFSAFCAFRVLRERRVPLGIRVASMVP